MIPLLDILKSLRGFNMKVGRHVSAQSLGVLGLISVMFYDVFQVHSQHLVARLNASLIVSSVGCGLSARCAAVRTDRRHVGVGHVAR